MNKRTQVIIAILFGFLAIGLITFLVNNHQKPAIQNSKLQVTASFYPLAYFAEQIGGDRVEVTNITPAGAEPHDYETTPADMAKMENSKLVILNGGHLEAWGDNVKQNLDSQKTLIVTAGEGLTNQQVVEEGKSIIDPHVWQSPLLVKQMVDKITVGFVQVDPANKDYYLANANNLKAKLDILDQDYRKGLSNCAEKNIITSHAAFGYLATTYGLNQVSIAGLSPDAEPSPQQLADIVKFAKANNVKYIFFESLVSPKLSDTIANEVGAKTLVLNPIEGLTNDEIAQGNSYFTEMEKNLVNLKIALACK